MKTNCNIGTFVYMHTCTTVLKCGLDSFSVTAALRVDLAVIQTENVGSNILMFYGCSQFTETCTAGNSNR